MEEQQILKLFATKYDFQEMHNELKEFHKEMNKFKNRTTNVLDQQTAILRKLDQEQTFGSHRVDKLETRITDAEADIANLKLKAVVA